MASLLAELHPGEGFVSSRLPEVKFMRSTRHLPRCPVVYEPSLVIVAQGWKVGTLGERSFQYDPGHYLTLTVPLPFECETFGTPEEPMLGLIVKVTPAIVTELLIQMEDRPAFADESANVVEATPLDEDLACAAVRLLECLRSAEQARILGPGIVREIVYFALLGQSGANLRALASVNGHLGRIIRVLNRLHANYAETVGVETLAREAGMSVSAFHGHFKALTALSPLQYVKAIRLHKARLLMVNEGASAAQAAGRVGYESPSQFSREFKRFFGDTPAAAASGMRASIADVTTGPLRPALAPVRA